MEPQWKQPILAAVGIGLLFGAAMASATGGSEEGSGNVVTERFDLSGFTGIEVGGSWQVTVRPGPYDVQVTVDDNLVDDFGSRCGAMRCTSGCGRRYGCGALRCARR